MKNLKLFTIVILILSNLLIFVNIFSISKNYPFNRLLIHGVLTHSIIIPDNSITYMAKVIKVNGIPIEKEIGTDYFLNKTVSSVDLLLSDGRTIVIHWKGGFNYNIFSFYIFLQIVGNIHILWGLLLVFSSTSSKTTRVYTKFSFLYGLIFLSSLLYLSEFNRIMVGVLGILTSALSYFLIESIYLMFSKNIKIASLFKVGVAFVIVSLTLTIEIFFHKNVSLVFLFLLTMILLSILIFALAYVIKIIESHENIPRLIISIVAGFLGAIVPLISFMLSIFYDFPVPVSMISVLTILIPIIIGGYIVNTNNFIPTLSARHYSSRLFIDYTISLVTAMMIYLIGNYIVSLPVKVFIVFFLPPLFLLMLYFRRIILKKIRKSTISVKDNYILSLQNIIEITGINEPIDSKIKKIISECCRVVNVNNAKIGLFSEYARERIKHCHQYISYYDEDSKIATYYKNNFAVIRHETLFKNELLSELNRVEEQTYWVQLVVPIEIKGIIVGFIATGKKNELTQYSRNDIQFLNSVGIILYQLIENEILFKNYEINDIYEKELDEAAFAQLRLYLKKVPPDCGMNIFFYNRPLNKLNGDFYDIIQLSPEKTAIIIGDVTGHGFPAAMIVSCLTILTSVMFDERKSLCEIMRYLNDFLIFGYFGNELSTLFIGIYDKTNRKMTYVNAGHCAPLLIKNSNNSIVQFFKRCNILGVSETSVFEEAEIVLEKEDEIMFYTDGLTEIHDSKTGFDIGESLLFDLLKKNSEIKIEKKVDLFIDYIDNLNKKFVTDDITILFAKVQ